MTTCQACGNPGTGTDPIVLAEGYRVQVSHVLDEASGFYGSVFQAATEAA